MRPSVVRPASYHYACRWVPSIASPTGAPHPLGQRAVIPVFRRSLKLGSRLLALSGALVIMPSMLSHSWPIPVQVVKLRQARLPQLQKDACFNPLSKLIAGG